MAQNNKRSTSRFYFQDYDDYLPHKSGEAADPWHHHWYDKVNDGYMDKQKIFKCPSDRNWGWSSSGDGSISYGYNYGYLGNDVGDPWYRLGNIANPSATIMVGDSNDSYGFAPTYKTTNIHSDGCNILFVDSHVEWLLESEITVDDTLWDRN